MRYHISGFVTSGRHCCYLFCAIVADLSRRRGTPMRRILLVLSHACDTLAATISSFLPAAIHNFATTSSPTGTCAGFSTSRSTWYYCRIFRYVTTTFNGYGSRLYVILLTTSRTSSFIVVLLTALLPAVCARAILHCVFSLVSTMLLTR